MIRRDFIKLFGGAAGIRLVGSSAPALGQDRMRQIGVLMGIADDQEGQNRVAAFRQGLRELGWIDGRNIGFAYHWGAGDIDSIRAQAMQLLASRPDLVLANSTIVATVLKQVTPTTPIVFVQVADPVRDGLVKSLAHPGGNITGFTSFEYAMGGKWLEILKEIAPALATVALLHHPQDSNWPGFARAIEAVAPSFGVQTVSAGVSDPGNIEAAITEFANSVNGGLIVLPTPITNLHRKAIFAAAARLRLPAVYPFRYHAVDGGLVSYGFDSVDPFYRAARYADRIFKGENPADLPVQAPTKYELVINLKTAKAIGLEVPPTLIARADEVIE